MGNIVIRSLCLSLFILCSSNEIFAQTVTEFFNTAYDFYKKKQFDQCIQTINQAISLKPDYAGAYQLRGNAYYGLKKNKAALADYSVVISLEPNNGVNYYNRANVYNILKEYDSALADYNNAVRLKPRYANGYGGRGSFYNNKKMYDLAIADFNKALSIDSTLGYVYNNRGLSYVSLGQYELAVADLKKALLIDVDLDHPYAAINLIEPLARLYRFKEAANYYNDFRTRYKTGYIDAPYWQFFKKYMEAISQSLAINDYATALTSLTQAENLYNTKSKTDMTDGYGRRGYSSILALKGYVLVKLNNDDGAKQAYEQALLINANEPEVVAALAELSKKKQVLVQADNTPPVINILEPLANSRSISVDDDKVAGTKQHIRGQAVDVSGIKSIMINNVPLKVEENGYFDTLVNITAGVNIFTIVATDRNANSISQNIQIVTGKDKAVAPPVVKADNALVSAKPIYHAVLIAESDYVDKNIPSLQGPANDMSKIYRLLVNNYVFSPENTDTLLNATRSNILEAIIKKANLMTENDNLFIFYAGHGQMITQPDGSEEGFLVPQDAVKDMVSSYISSDDLMRTIKYSKAKHILFVADACFAGSLFRDIPSNVPVPVAEAYKDKSRRLLASGNRTTVPDKSDFIEYLRIALQENHAPYITAEQLIDSFKDQYTTTTHLTLQYYPIKNVDDLGGQFVFMRK